MQYGYIHKKEFSFDALLNADEIKNYIKKEIKKENLTFMFNTKTIPFEVRIIILRSDKDARIFENQLTEIRNSRIIRSINTEEQILNIGKTFKSDECVICLTNPSNVLFCNCGHIPICVECDTVKSL